MRRTSLLRRSEPDHIMPFAIASLLLGEGQHEISDHTIGIVLAEVLLFLILLVFPEEVRARWGAAIRARPWALWLVIGVIVVIFVILTLASLEIATPFGLLTAIAHFLNKALPIPIWLIGLFLALALIVPRDLVFRIRRRHGSVDRAFFVGRWEWGVHHQNQVKLAALLNGDGTASNDQRGRGRWEYRDNTCIVQWDNGWRDELYQAPHGFVKLAYENGQFRNASTAKKM